MKKKSTPQIRLRLRPQIQVKRKPKIVLTDFISEISGILHYALLMIPTGGGIRVIGGGDARRPGGGIPVTGGDARRLVQHRNFYGVIITPKME